MLKSIFKAVGVFAVATVFCIGCGDKSDDDPDDVGGGETKATYTITFDANGGTVSPKSAKTGTDGKLDSLPTPTRTGYDFDGWFTAKTGGSAVAASRTYTANATIYARWTEKSVNPPDTANPGDTTGNGASGLVLGIEEAWLFEPEEDETEQSGLIFRQNGTVEVVYTEDGDTWHIAEDESGTYTLSGNNSITVKIFGDTLVMTFSISGNKLTLRYSDGSTDVLTKKNGVKVDDSGEVGETLYTINFDANGGTVSPMSSKTNKDGKLASLPEPTRDGYDFDGWYTAKTGGTEVTESKVYTANTTIYARWTEEPVTPTTYIVTFNHNYSGSTNTTATTGADGKLTSLPEPTRSGYTFDGWYTAATGGTEITANRMYTANTTIYAQWTKEPVTPPNGGNLVLPDGYAWMEGCSTCSGIIFKSDGTFQMLNQQNETEAVVTGSGTYTTSGNSVTLVGVTWPTGATTYSVSGETLSCFLGNLRKMSVTIVSAATYYTVTFDYNYSGSTNTTATTGTDGKLATLPTPTRSGYTFDGWYTTSVIGGTVVTTSTVFTTSVTIWARWTESVTQPSGSFVCADGEVWSYGTTLPCDGCDGRIFLSNNEYWNVQGEAGVKWTAMSKGTWSVSGNQLTISGAYGTEIFTYSVAGDKLTLTSQSHNGNLTKLSGIDFDYAFRVAFDANGGTVSPTSGKTNKDGKLISLPEPTRSGYDFDGWYTAKTGGTEVTTSTVFTSIAIIYARWTEETDGGEGGE